MTTHSRIQAVVRLRPKNQITLPEPVANALGAEVHDRLVFAADADHPDFFTAGHAAYGVVLRGIDNLARHYPRPSDWRDRVVFLERR